MVLAGGGTRGAYQDGAVRALRELHEDHWQIITGTSIGALNGAMVVQGDDEAMHELWSTLTQDMIIKGSFSTDLKLETIVDERKQLATFLRSYVREKGADISPFFSNIQRLYHPDKFFASDIDFACVAVHHITLKPVFITKDMMRESGADWLLSSASAFPAFPVHKFNDNEYIDGGYYDNLPIDLALRMGADEIIAVDLSHQPQHPNYIGRKHIRYIYPRVETGSFLSFDRETLDLLNRLGYLDAKKCFGALDGEKYTFERMALPEWSDTFQVELLKLEARIKQANAINDSFRSGSYIYDRLCEQLHRRSLSEREMIFGLMDDLMDLAGCDVTRVWTYREARNAVLASFASCIDKDYPILPGLIPSSVLEYLQTMDLHGIVEKLVHRKIYPEHGHLPENAVLTLNPFAQALADVIIYMLIELGEEPNGENSRV